MTLEEAIKHCEEVTEELKDKANHIGNLIHDETWEYCLECAEEHKQLAEWLKELKSRREKDEWLKNILDTDDDEVL